MILTRSVGLVIDTVWAMQLGQNRISMSLDDRVPGHIGADQCGVEMYNLAGGDPGRYTCFYCSRQNGLEAFGPPALANAR